MQTIRSIELHAATREERLPGFAPDFPYIATRACVDQYAERFVPWHWHKTVELFYMESGTLEYFVPHGRRVFAAGMAGFVNANVLHMTRPAPGCRVVQLLHLFDPSLIAGAPGGRIERQYVLPVLAGRAFDLVAFDPADPAQARTAAAVRAAFSIPDGQPGYELRLRAALSEIWLALLAQCPGAGGGTPRAADGQLKRMVSYIYDHYPEKITVRALAAAAFVSERECYRLFRENLRVTPGEYILACRIQAACRLLRETAQSAAQIAAACGLGGASYFGRVFRQEMGCTPRAYRENWQDRDKTGR